jgi:hypothetical protein
LLLSLPCVVVDNKNDGLKNILPKLPCWNYTNNSPLRERLTRRILSFDRIPTIQPYARKDLPWDKQKQERVTSS